MTKNKQRSIRFIESMLRVKFNGITNHDAWMFINKNIQRATRTWHKTKEKEQKVRNKYGCNENGSYGTYSQIL